MIQVLSLALRAASFVALLQAAGIALFLPLFGATLASSRTRVRRLGTRSAWWATACVVGQLALEPARLAGEWNGIADPALLRTVLGASIGAAATTRIAGLTLLATTLPRPSPAGTALAILGATLAVSSFILTGHTAVSSLRALLCLILLWHLLVVAFWFGTLAALVKVARCEPATVTADTLRAFSRVALYVVPGILVAGLLLAWGLVPGLAVLGRPYGAILLAKLGVFLVLMGLALWNKSRLTPAIARGAPRAIALLRGSIAAEYGLIVVVLALTAAMTSLYAPE